MRLPFFSKPEDKEHPAIEQMRKSMSEVGNSFSKLDKVTKEFTISLTPIMPCPVEEPSE